ncbi:MAG TPA: ATP citrate lyase citrate-binding domain-containing protein [Patescibacteria group bacterium]|nr:ATP citrate lyase citrate-binding domain-containing protein [Patescibacteria group bacterium]
MPRVKLSEFRAKTIVNNYMGTSYSGFPFHAKTDAISKIDDAVNPDKKYVAKVDQGIKKRFKQGLVALDLKNASDIVDAIATIRKKHFDEFLVEEYIPHEQKDEKYISFERTAKGIVIHYASSGGVDIEDHSHEVKSILYKDSNDARKVAAELGVEPESFVEKLLELFDINYFSFLEINPLVISFKKPYMLDIAAEVDSAAEFFVDTWSSNDFRNSRTGVLTEEEKNIHKLSEKSSSSLTLTVLNPNGAIFMLLSGGGVSLALADEVANLGKGDLLANYGEYSGNPTEEETYIYTKNLLSLLLKSTAAHKVLIIGGGVANFTDVRVTFRGIIHAMTDVMPELQRQNVKVFVRRGGPHQAEGLAHMESYLKENGIEGSVHGPKLVVSEIVAKALESITIDN